MIIGIDHGNGRIKTRRVDFLSGVSILDEPPVVQAGDVIEWNGKWCVLNGERRVLERDKTLDGLAFVAGLFAFTGEVKARGIAKRDLALTIAAGLPIADMARLRPSFARYLRATPGDWKFRLNGEEWQFHVDDVLVFPQGYAAVTKYMHQIKAEPVAHVVDIGAGTTDMLTIHSGLADDSSMSSDENLGVISCISYAIKQTGAATGVMYRPEQVERVLWHENVRMTAEHKALLRQACREWCAMALARVREAGFNYHVAPTYIVGGGAYLIRRYYADEHADELSNVEFNDDIHANANGYEMLAIACAAEANRS